MHQSLDPDNWPAFRQQSHAMLDDMLDYIEHRRERPVWKNSDADLRKTFQSPLPEKGQDLSSLHQRFMDDILPYAVGNTHPGFMGWAHGGGTPVGMVAEILSAGLNANVGGRNQVPICVELQITQWMAQLFEFPINSSSGLFLSGTSMANFVSVLIAQSKILGVNYRRRGNEGYQLTAYCAESAHQCISQAFSMAGLGSDCLRKIAVDDQQKMNVNLLKKKISDDLKNGFIPFYCAATVGTVDCGAIDDLSAISTVCKDYDIWLHVDGAFGALAQLSPLLKPLLSGIEKADSIAFDFHKWLQVPYDAGFLLCKHKKLHYQTFSDKPQYLQRTRQGLAGGNFWPCDYGPDLSRGFKALKTWFTLSHYGSENLGQQILHSCHLAILLSEAIEKHNELELLAPVSLNIVCFRYRLSDKYMSEDGLNALNENIVTLLQQQGRVAPSTTTLDGKTAIRAAFINHRTEPCDVTALISSVLENAQQLIQPKHIPATGEKHASNCSDV